MKHEKKGDCLSNEIHVQKTTVLIVFSLLLAVVAGAYVVNTTTPGVDNGQNAAANQSPIAAFQQLVPSGGCGCGGGGLGCGGGIQVSAPDPSKVALLNTSDSPTDGNAQDIYLRALNDGTYDRQEITVRKGVPVRLHFTADPDAGCGRQMVIYGLNIRALSKNGEENIVEFIPKEAGTYEYNCGMRMWRPGKLVVTS